MAKNITILGASYSDVPAVQLPQTGGGTARFDDCSVVTAVASDVAQGKVFVASDGTVTTGTASGGGGADVPTFTVIWSDDYSSVVSVTCDKSYAECDDILETAGFALIVDNIQSGTAEMLGTATATGSDGSSLRYTAYFGGVYPSYDIVYYSNGTISAVYPSQMVETLNATTNGTYYPQGGIITEVEVNVPQPSGSISITQNGTVDVTNYASAVVNVSGGTSKNTQTAQSTSRSTSSTYTEVISLTCTKAGTYNVYWSTFRSSTSGTWGSQLYLNDTAYGSAQTGSWSNHVQNIHLSNVQIDANEEVAVRVRTRGSNYYGYVGTLTIIEV